MTKLETYLRDLRDTRATGEAVKETSFYPALATLLNAVGAELNPKVRAVINLKNRGAGLPDGGLFTAKQLKKLGGDEALHEPAAFKGQQPERGVIEVKGAGENVRDIVAGEQVARYLRHYGQVLVTNLREFLLVGREASGALKFLEFYALAESEKEFWQLAQHPRELAAAHGARFSEYLKRVMLSLAPLDAPESLAWFLASYARDARERIEHEQVALEPLQNVRGALESALGLRFEGEQGEQFFRSTLVQTLFYGVFSAWVLWSKSVAGKKRGSRFDWRMAAWTLHVPVIRTLFEQVVTPSNVRGLGLEEVLDWTADTLNRVEREKFFERFEREHAVQYFYEPFLEAFDPELRKQLGVWYTPGEIVRYMVERTDRVLREELQIERGLADERVYVLDPCCGTGAYLVEVLKRIKHTIDEAGGDALAADDLKQAALKRVFGFEILPAPFVVAHLQLGLLLQTEGSPLAGDERVGVYLTNALTGWEPPREPKTRLLFPELEQEREAAERVKQQTPILVVIGNPPYNGFAGVAVEEERSLSNAYRTTKRAPLPQGQGLNDLYVRFFRMAERRIVEMTGAGVVSYISNYSWLDGLSFTGMRERYLEAFDLIQIDCLNGDKYKTGKVTPGGKPDPSVFSTPSTPEGIQVGTAISLFVRRERHAAANAVRFRHFWGKGKKDELVDSLHEAGDASAHPYVELAPASELGLPFMPLQFEASYFAWPLLPELLPVSFPGVKTSRDDVVVDIDRERLIARMENYFDPDISHEELRRIAPGAMEKSSGFNPIAVREYLQQRGFQPQNIIRYCYRPFDIRWLYRETETNLIDRKREEYLPQVFDGNAFMFTTGRTRKALTEPPLFTQLPNDLNCMDSGARGFPTYVLELGDSLFSEKRKVKPNLSSKAVEYLRQIGSSEIDLFYHCFSIISSPLYRYEHSGALRSNFPRIPLPATRESLEESAALGRQVAQLLDTETTVAGVTGGAIRPELRHIAVIRRADGTAGALNPQAGDLELRAGWGHKGKAGVVMPGKGRTRTRDYTEGERAALPDNLAAWGDVTHDIFLNDTAAWANVPARVWDYTIGGYQVIKKWLSYREGEILGRSLTVEEAREVTQTARRIAAIRLLETELDANYQRSAAACYGWGN